MVGAPADSAGERRWGLLTRTMRFVASSPPLVDAGEAILPSMCRYSLAPLGAVSLTLSLFLTLSLIHKKSRGGSTTKYITGC